MGKATETYMKNKKCARKIIFAFVVLHILCRILRKIIKHKKAKKAEAIETAKKSKP